MNPNIGRLSATTLLDGTIEERISTTATAPTTSFSWPPTLPGQMFGQVTSYTFHVPDRLHPYDATDASAPYGTQLLVMHVAFADSDDVHVGVPAAIVGCNYPEISQRTVGLLDVCQEVAFGIVDLMPRRPPCMRSLAHRERNQSCPTFRCLIEALLSCVYEVASSSLSG